MLIFDFSYIEMDRVIQLNDETYFIMKKYVDSNKKNKIYEIGFDRSKFETLK